METVRRIHDLQQEIVLKGKKKKKKSSNENRSNKRITCHLSNRRFQVAPLTDEDDKYVTDNSNKERTGEIQLRSG